MKLSDNSEGRKITAGSCNSLDVCNKEMILNGSNIVEQGRQKDSMHSPIKGNDYNTK